MQEVSPGAREYRPNGPSVVILGGGFGGLHAARALRDAPVQVTLVDRRRRGAAVGELLGGFQLSGFLAWLAWLVVHIYFLMGFRNRLLVMFHWAYSYLTYRRGRAAHHRPHAPPDAGGARRGEGKTEQGPGLPRPRRPVREPTRWPRATRMRLKGWKILSKPSNRPARNRPNEERTMTATAKITKRSTMQEVLRARRRLAETA